MTVKELRELLKQFPDDAEVWILDGFGYYETKDPAGEIDYRDGIVFFGS
jgi:hypothetical protein